MSLMHKQTSFLEAQQKFLSSLSTASLMRASPHQGLSDDHGPIQGVLPGLIAASEDQAAQLPSQGLYVLHDFPMHGIDPAKADREDYIEAMLRADAIATAVEKFGGSLYARPHSAHGLTTTACSDRPMACLSSPTQPAPDASSTYLDLCTHRGFIKNHSLKLIDGADAEAHYGTAQWFKDNALRDIVLVRNGDAEEDPNHAALPSFYDGLKQFSGRRCVWKTLGGRLKQYAVEFLDLEDGLSGNMQVQDIALATVHSGGLSLLQGDADMAYEYRVFVVDGKPITGGGCVASHTPIDGIAKRYQGFSPLMQKYGRTRGSQCKTEIESRPDLAAFYFHEAMRIAALIKADPQGPKSYVLDLFVNGQKAPARAGIVELNPLLAAGLYSSDVYALMEALIGSYVKTHLQP